MARHRPRYSIVFLNHSSQSGTVCVYQTQQDEPAGTSPVAWFTKEAAPSTMIVFSWSYEYSFMWSMSGPLGPHAVFVPSQTAPADLVDMNQITLEREGNVYRFTKQSSGPAHGTLYLQQADDVTLDASVGIGMDDRPVLAAQAQPGGELVVVPRPVYWISFGDFRPHEVLDPTEFTNLAKVSFPSGVASMTAVYTDPETWTIFPTNMQGEEDMPPQGKYTKVKTTPINGQGSLSDGTGTWNGSVFSCGDFADNDHPTVDTYFNISGYADEDNQFYQFQRYKCVQSGKTSDFKEN